MKFCSECGESVKFEGVPEWGERGLTVYGCKKCDILWVQHYNFPSLKDRTEYYNKYTIKTLSEWKKEEKVIAVHIGCGGDIIKKEDCSWCNKCKKYFCGCALG